MAKTSCKCGVGLCNGYGPGGINGEPVQDEHRNSFLSDAVYGFVLGDALGVPYEFKQRGSFNCEGMTGYGTHNQPPGTWSDDSSLMLATCRSIKDNNLSINLEDLKNKFLSWLNNNEFTALGNVFDIGNATYKALRTGIAPNDEHSNGNGSLMRILPLAFIDCTDDEIRAVSGITHDHWISKEACVIYVNVIKRYLNQDFTTLNTKKITDFIKEIPEYPAPFDRLCRLSSLTENDINSTGYVIDTLEAAFWCVLQAEKEGSKTGYDDCLMKAVNLGGNTDTIAAVTGGLAGLLYDFDQLPDDWIWKLKNNKLIQECLW